MSRSRICKIIFSLGLLLILISTGLAVFNFYDASRAEKEARATEAKIEARLEEMTSGSLAGAGELAGSGESAGSDGAAGFGGGVSGGSLEFVDGQDTDVVIPEMETMEIDGELYIGTIEVPSLGMKLPIISDWDSKKLKKSPCRYSGNYYSDDLVLCGHNYRGGRHFGPIKNITAGADVYLTTVTGDTLHYAVIRGEKLGPRQVEKMVSKTDWDLTLYTCTSNGSERLTVRCVRVED